MESIEEIAERLLNGWHSPKEAINLLIADPAFRRLMAEELAKVDMEPAYCGGNCYGGYFFTQEQLTAAVLKERESLSIQQEADAKDAARWRQLQAIQGNEAVQNVLDTALSHTK